MLKPSKRKLVFRFVLVTITVLVLFVAARIAFSTQELRAELQDKAEIVATRVAGAVHPASRRPTPTRAAMRA